MRQAIGVPEEVMSWKLERVREEAVVARRRRAVQGGGRRVVGGLMVAMEALWVVGEGEEEAVREGWVAGKVGRSVGRSVVASWRGGLAGLSVIRTRVRQDGRGSGGSRRDPSAQRPRGEFVGRDDGLAEQLETGCVSEVRGGGRRDDDGSAMMQSQESIELVNAAVQEVLAQPAWFMPWLSYEAGCGGDRLKDGVRESATPFSGEPGGKANQVGGDI